MNNPFLFYELLGLCALILIIKLLLKERLPKYPAKPIPTQAECNFLHALESAVGNSYDIFPQIAVAKLIHVPYRSLGWNKTSQKSVDFVLVDKKDYATKLVIELDDFSHNFTHRIERDMLVNTILRNANIPVLRYPNKRYYISAHILVAIQKALQKN